MAVEKEWNLDEQMARFNVIEKKVESDRRELNNREARFELKREQYQASREVLEGMGTTFTTGKELQTIYKGKKARVESLLVEMESALGIVDEEEDEDGDEESLFTLED